MLPLAFDEEVVHLVFLLLSLDRRDEEPSAITTPRFAWDLSFLSLVRNVEDLELSFSFDERVPSFLS